MFGYVRILDGELKVREYTLYKSVYCGLCRTMGKRTCRSSTLSLSYDFTFLAFFRAALCGEGFTVTKTRCGLHPFKKRPIAEENTALKYCAGAAAVLKYYKLLDDLSDKDKKGLKRLVVKSLLPTAKRHLNKAIKTLPEFDLDALSDKVAATLSELSRLETSASPSPDACADAFGKTLSAVFSHAIDGSDKIKTAERIGYHIGKWIYFADAVNDFEEDKANRCFNPFIAAGYDTLPVGLISDCMTMELGAAFDTFKQIDFKYSDIGNIIINTLTLGMPAQLSKITAKFSRDKTTEEQ